MLLLRTSRPIARHTLLHPLRSARAVSTLPNNPHIYIHTDPVTSTHTLSLLPTSPPTATLSIGTTPTLPPTPQTFRENPSFHGHLHATLAAHAVHDPTVRASAAAYASTAGASPLLNSSSAFPPNHPSSQNASSESKRSRPSRGPGSMGGGGGGTTKHKSAADAGGGGAGGASAQGGMGGAGRGGWVHVSDARNPPDYGRIAWPEDIFGSVEVDGRGDFVSGNGNYQASGTYRVCTREGFLGLSPYLREKVVERLRGLEEAEKK